MPVTKTAKRAFRSSKRKEAMNKKTIAELELAIRNAKKNKKQAEVVKVFSLADRAAKKNTIHKRKAAHIKSAFSRLLSSR